MLTRTRQQLVEDRAAVKNKIRMKFRQWELIESDKNRTISHKLVQELPNCVTATEPKIVIESYWNIWKKLDEEISKLTQAIKEQAKTDPNEATYPFSLWGRSPLCSLPGWADTPMHSLSNGSSTQKEKSYTSSSTPMTEMDTNASCHPTLDTTLAKTKSND